MPAEVVLSELAAAALRLAARERPGDGWPLATAPVLAALARLDQGNDWSRLWLYTGDPDALHLASTPDQPNLPGGSTWENVPLTPAMAVALTLVSRMCDAYDLAPAPTGVLALALVGHADSGAAMTLVKAGVSHDELLEIVQSDLIGSHLEGLPELIAASERPDSEDEAGEAGTTDKTGTALAAILGRAQSRAGRRLADELDLLAVLCSASSGSDPSSQNVLERLGFEEALIETFEAPVRAIGLHRLDGVAARIDEGTDRPALRLLVSLADKSSPGLSALFQMMGINSGELAAGAIDAIEADLGHHRDPGRRVIVLGVLNVVSSIVVTALIVINVLGPGTLWELFLVPLPWLGNPGLPSALGLVFAVPIGLAVTPVAGAVQVVIALIDWLAARAERRAMIVRTGIVISAAASRRIAMRRTSNGRLVLMLRLLLRMRFAAPRLLRESASARRHVRS